MSLFTVFFQMLALLIMIGAGFLATKLHMMDDLHTILLVGLIAIAMFAVFIIVGMILAPLFDKNQFQKRIYQLMFVFSNLGFIGIPVVSSILGAEYVVYVTEFMLIYTVVFYTYGVALMTALCVLTIPVLMAVVM